MNVGVIGSGSIGPDLAYGFLSALGKTPGAQVFLVDVKQDALDAGVARIKGYVDKAVGRGKLAPAAGKALLAQLRPTLALSDLASCGYVLEAASENLTVKRAILRELEAIVSADCLIGFATSGLPRAQIAAEAKHPLRCFVNHPFYPAWRSLPIEIVSASNSPHTARMLQTMRTLGKVPIVTADVECFAADDIFCNYISEAARIVEEGLAAPAQVDAVVDAAIGGGGPFQVMDLTRGNLLTVHCQELMQQSKAKGQGTAWFAPPAILSKQGNTSWHDRKAPGNPACEAGTAAAIIDRICAVLFARTFSVIENGTCDPSDTDWLTRMSLGFKKGLPSLALDMGPAKVKALCAAYAATHPGFVVPTCIQTETWPAFFANVRSERQDDIGIVRVFRPEVKNALSKQTLDEIDRAMTAHMADPSIKGIVFTSFDGALAGADINELAALPDAEAGRQTCLAAAAKFARMAASPKPIVAAVDGAVMGGGAEISMACHARVVGPALMLAQPEVNLGIIPGYGGSQRLPRLIGFARACDVLRTGRVVGAADACAWGWAHGTPAADPMAAAIALIREHLAGKVKLAPVSEAPLPAEAIPPADIGHRSLAIDAILRDVIVRGTTKPLSEGLAIEADGFARCKHTVDLDIGMKNFIQNGPRVPAAFLHE